MARGEGLQPGNYTWGVLRNVKRVRVEPKTGEPFDQLQVTLEPYDDQDDYMPRLVVPRELEGEIADALAGKKGQMVVLRTNPGNYGKTWCVEYVGTQLGILTD